MSHVEVVIVPGWNGSGPAHWQTIWEQNHPDTFVSPIGIGEACTAQIGSAPWTGRLPRYSGAWCWWRTAWAVWPLPSGLRCVPIAPDGCMAPCWSHRPT